MINLPWTFIVIILGEVVQILWLLVLTFALVAERHRHDRLVDRVRELSRGITKVSRMRTRIPTGELPVTRSMRPPPPFPVPPPHTNPMATAKGRHSAT